MRFQTPQFIEVEDKIFGPFTFKQMIYVAGGFGAAFILWTYLQHFLALLIGAPILALGLGLAFYKINNRPLIEVAEAAFSYVFNARLYIWKKNKKKVTKKKTVKQDTQKTSFVPKLSESKLKDLSWSLDIQESEVSL